MLDGEHVSFFRVGAIKNNGKSMKFPFFRVLAAIVICVVSPGCVNASAIRYGQSGSEFKIGGDVLFEMRLHKFVGEVAGFFTNPGVKLDEGIIKGRQEFGFGLLGEKFASSLLGNSSANPSAAKASGERASNTEPSCDDRVTHVLWAYVAGVGIGLLVLAIFGWLALRPRRHNVKVNRPVVVGGHLG